MNSVYQLATAVSLVDIQYTSGTTIYLPRGCTAHTSMQSLHWLLSSYQVKVKDFSSYKALYGPGPIHLQDHLSYYVLTCKLGLFEQSFLKALPCPNTAFSVVAF